MFIQFDPANGELIRVTNSQPDFDFIEVDKEDIIEVHTGKISAKKYIVVFNDKLGKYQLQKKDVINVFNTTIHNILYEIPTNKNREGITIIQDISNSCWKFLINKDLEIDLKSRNSFTNYSLYFSVTELGNPNLLYRQLEINLEQLVKNHYQIVSFLNDFEKTELLVSVYTNKIFEYNYERKE